MFVNCSASRGRSLRPPPRTATPWRPRQHATTGH